MSAFFSLVQRDVMLSFRIGGGAILGLTFFLTVGALMPLGIGPEPQLLSKIAPGLIWVLAVLTALLTLDRIFQADFEDGSLDQIALGELPVWLCVFAKVLAHWLTTGLPLCLFAPLMGLLFGLAPDGYWPLVLGLLLGTPALSLTGAMGAALTVALRRGGLLLSLIVLPLYIPVLIFGAGSVIMAVDGLGADGALMMVAALSLFSLVISLPLSALSLKTHLS